MSRRKKVLVIGLDCAPPELVFDQWRDELPNFKRVMDRQVGKSIDDPDAYPVYYRLRLLTTKPVPKGNMQQVYAAGREGKCQVGYELDASRKRVIRPGRSSQMGFEERGRDRRGKRRGRR